MSALLPGIFDCQRCERLSAHLGEVKRRHPSYHARPVAAFGDAAPRLLIVGLAPGLHGANRTGRPFTGDHAGIMLYATLHRYGFASRAESVEQGDGLVLTDCRITNAVKCLPPGNRPLPIEVKTCNDHLAAELASHLSVRVFLALGRVAHEAILRALGLRQSAYRFSHGARHALPQGGALFDSYHCSRYNTQTGRLTLDAFAGVVERIRDELDGLRHDHRPAEPERNR